MSRLLGIGIGPGMRPQDQTNVRVVLQQPLHRVLAFLGRSIDDLVNDPIVKNQVLGYYKVYRQVERVCEVVELEALVERPVSPKPVAIITGAGGGIGRAVAVELSAMGYRLVLAGRTARTLKQSLTAAGGRGIILPTDMTEPTQVRALVAGTLEALGRIDVVINAAGYAVEMALDQTSDDQWRQIIDTNLSAAFYLCREAWPSLKKSAVRGSDPLIVNISSFAARDPFPGLGAFGAAKAGLNLLSLMLSREGAPLGIRVHTIAPAAVETPMFRRLRTRKQVPKAQTLSPKAVARVVAGCINGELRHTSGEVIYIHR